MEEEKIRDIVIIGAGPAGMTAAIYTARAGYDTVVLDKEGPGGQMVKSPKIENFPGIQATSGATIGFNMFKQIEELGVEFSFEEVLSVNQSLAKNFIVKTNEREILAKSIIIATGAAPVDLPIPGGVDYIGDGVYYCAVCDGPLFKGKRVLVVGDGNSAAQYALELSKYCSDVTICGLSSELICEKAILKEINETQNIKKMLPAKITKIQKHPNGIMVASFENKEDIKVEAIFVAIGQKPATEFLKDTIELNERGYIVSSDLTTKVDGIFVAGDCRTKRIRQAVAAAGDGAEAAILAMNYIKGVEEGDH